ncbi:ketosynthase chain-length factor [Kitasatospora sp. A2-31]|uniref:ketosynthase chain-length factor n=1 Tax=Kitasatospora sp. A2-31 TaxID=2916414 RepID=UPI001EE9F37D|nr:ketosynthase chain-length factor [Kitasatospora sp. A2-31]MCG6495609.1 ketosynthase chain-length factor [Kitasatospora sp. A2-31]
MTAVVTGLGVLAPNGVGLDAYWAATLRGESGIDRLTRFDPEPYPSRLAGEITGFDPAALLPNRLLPQTDPVTRLSLVAAEWALADADLDPAGLSEYDIGVVTANTAGGFEFGQRELQNLWSKGGAHVSAYQSFAWFYAVNTGQISIRHGMRGPSGVVVADGAGGLDALAQARRLIRKGTPVVVSGAVDGSLCPWSWTAQLTSGTLSTREDPAEAYLPFDDRACGHVLGEGGAILVMEDAGAARARGARIHGRLTGYGTSFDGHRAPERGADRGAGLGRAARQALDQAGWRPADVDVVFADAAGTPAADRAEAAALADLFGPHGVPVTAPKTMTGRLAAGSGPLDVATALLALRDQVIPPTANVRRPVAGYALDLVTEPRRQPLRRALVLARGHGGFNSAVAVEAPAG